MSKTNGWEKIEKESSDHYFYRNGNNNWGDIIMKRKDQGIEVKSKICKNGSIIETGIGFKSMAQADLWIEFTKEEI